VRTGLGVEVGFGERERANGSEGRLKPFKSEQIIVMKAFNSEQIIVMKAFNSEQFTIMKAVNVNSLL